MARFQFTAARRPNFVSNRNNSFDWIINVFQYECKILAIKMAYENPLHMCTGGLTAEIHEAIAYVSK